MYESAKTVVTPSSNKNKPEAGSSKGETAASCSIKKSDKTVRTNTTTNCGIGFIN